MAAGCSSETPPTAGLGPCLRQWRAVRRCKQSHLAELLGVSQTTVSRWESGVLTPGRVERDRLVDLLQARLTTAADRQLARLVVTSSLPVHLVCDLTHRLLACSAARARQLRKGVAEMLGVSLWPAATPEIAAAEAALPALGWFDGRQFCHEADTRAQSGTLVDIHAGRFRWTRFRLAGGAFVRLVETIGTAGSDPAATGQSRRCISGGPSNRGQRA